MISTVHTLSPLMTNLARPRSEYPFALDQAFEETPLPSAYTLVGGKLAGNSAGGSMQQQPGLIQS